jgi:O-antigen biosynthesis protein
MERLDERKLAQKDLSPLRRRGRPAATAFGRLKRRLARAYLARLDSVPYQTWRRLHTLLRPVHLSYLAWLRHGIPHRPRIVLKAFSELTNGHSTVSGAEEYVLLTDGEAKVCRGAILWLGTELAVNPDTEVIYFDEEYFDTQRRAWTPIFKPAWNPELFRTHDFIGPNVVIRRELLNRVLAGKGRKQRSVQQIISAASELVPGKTIRHLPSVLARYRACPAWRAETARAAATAQAPMDTEPHVSLIIPTYNRPELLKKCIESILHKTSYRNFDIQLVDNRSNDPGAIDYLRALGTHPRVTLRQYQQPFNFAAINNFAVGSTDAPIIALLNNDVEVISPGWLKEMVRHAARPDVGAVGAMLYYPDDTIQHAGVVLGIGGIAAHAFVKQPRGSGGYLDYCHHARAVSAVTAACLVMRREVYAEVGGMEENLPNDFNDVDLCLKMLARGYRIIWTPLAELYHHESATRKSVNGKNFEPSVFSASCEFMRRQWADQLENDPSYHPAFSLRHPPFQSFRVALQRDPWPSRTGF